MARIMGAIFVGALTSVIGLLAVRIAFILLELLTPGSLPFRVLRAPVLVGEMLACVLGGFLAATLARRGKLLVALFAGLLAAVPKAYGITVFKWVSISNYTSDPPPFRFGPLWVVLVASLFLLGGFASWTIARRRSDDQASTAPNL